MATEKRLIDANYLVNKGIRNCPIEEGGIPLGDFAQHQKILDLYPTVEAVEVVHGRWREKILVGGFAEEWGYVCSECGCTVSDRSNLSFGRFERINQRLNYCPNCGAKMDGDGNVDV